MPERAEVTNQIHHGDAIAVLQSFPESSIHSCITSPPYFAQRDYNVDGQIGLEDSVEGYVEQLVTVGREIRRVIREDGSWWLNLGDTFSGGGGMTGVPDDHDGKEAKHSGKSQPDEPVKRQLRYKRKNKLLIPQRVAIALQEDGWIIRNNVTWVKSNAMPESVKDRLSTRTERLYHLVPNPEYWYDLDAIREPYETETIARANRASGESKWVGGADGQSSQSIHTPTEIQGGLNPLGKNPGDVFEVPTKSYKDAHFAVFPPELIERPLKATTPPHVCADCGMPYERETITKAIWEVPRRLLSRDNAHRALELAEEACLTVEHLEAARQTGIGNLDQSEGIPTDRVDTETAEQAKEAYDVLGTYYRECLNSVSFAGEEWEQVCQCETDERKPGIVLDPFAGSGTTLEVAKNHQRRFVGIELNEEYVSLAQKRVGLTVENPENLVDDDQSTLAAEW